MDIPNGQALTDFIASTKTTPKAKAVVLFYASYCSFCRDIMPNFESTARLSPYFLGRMEKAAMTPQMRGACKLQMYPTLITFQNGKEVSRMAGSPKDEDELSAYMGVTFVQDARRSYMGAMKLDWEAARPDRAERSFRGSGAVVRGGDLRSCGGARIMEVVDGSPAAHSMRVGDILAAIDGLEVTRNAEIRGALWAQGQLITVAEFMYRAVEPRPYKIQVWRGGRLVPMHVQPTEAKGTLQRLFPPFETIEFLVVDGLVLMTSCANLLVPQVFPELCSKSRSELFNNHFVVVVNVLRGTRAAMEGSIRRGSIITHVKGARVHTVGDVVHAMDFHNPEVDTTAAFTLEAGGRGRRVVFGTSLAHIFKNAHTLMKRHQVFSSDPVLVRAIESSRYTAAS